ncbi:gamma-glutamyl-gamma-aminobutyrate hydrolase family protein [Legionella gresilensis]|uniref:gamma-glutamyl-gamma-aminobutyrate hydrolase family protein n=1 Tax=Legionella gresilensis TaxID=91823 RepID=UPI001040ED65
MTKIKVAVTFSPEVGGVSVFSLMKLFTSANFEVIEADYREIMRAIPMEKFTAAYTTPEGRNKLFAHTKYMASELLNNVSCLALSGNTAMIDPHLFNEARNTNELYDFSRTIAELALIHVATQRGMPILGVCGGHQALAVYSGCTVRPLSENELGRQGFRSYDKIIFNIQSLLG